MKIDRSRASHWWYLAAFGLCSVLALAWRRLRGRRAPAARRQVVLYGHKLGGNLLALHRHLAEERANEFDVAFLSMDAAYVAELALAGVRAVRARGVACLRLLAHADAVISDHGLHAMLPLLGHSDIRFFDVWHGIPFKGFDADDFRVQHRYDEAWVASPLLARLYVERFGFDAARVHATGYARTDELVRPRHSRAELLDQLGLAQLAGRKIVCFAPTWKQDSAERSLFPFGLDEEAFLGRLLPVCRDAGAVLLLRRHLNSGTGQARGDDCIELPYARYPDTEAVLQASDVLVCDWSSIAFDYLLLDRPTIFLDVEPPFRKGFSLGPEYRFGSLAAGIDELAEQLAGYLARPEDYMHRHGDATRAIKQAVYGECADGHSSERCANRLIERLSV